MYAIVFKKFLLLRLNFEYANSEITFTTISERKIAIPIYIHSSDDFAIGNKVKYTE